MAVTPRSGKSKIMILHTKVYKDGTLNAKIPPFFWGKRVVISITEETDLKTTSQRESKHDETAYLLSSSANEKQLEQAKKELEDGQWVEVDNLDELFK